MNKLIRKNQGIVLITTLIVAGFMMIFASAVLVSVLRQNLVVSRYYEKEAALQAATAGINYAMMRISNDPGWKGYGESADGSAYQLEMPGQLQVKEHSISGSLGCVEGQIKMGDSTGYFDIYFIDPSLAAGSMEYFGENSPGGSIPSEIPISLNNNENPDTSTANLYKKGEGISSYRDIPPRSIMLACRGKVGRESKIIETCVTVGPESKYDSVVVGRGDIQINVGANGDLSLLSGPQNKPPIMRSNNNIIISSTSTNTDYLEVDGQGGGYAYGSVSFDPEPENNSDKFKTNAGEQQEALPPLQMSKIKPATSDFSTIPAGIYKIEPDSNHPSYPKVTYYPTDNPENILSEDNPDGVESSSSNAIPELIRNGVLSWDNEKCILTINESLSVKQENDLSNLAIISNGLDRVVVKLNSTIDPETLKLNPVYLVNENSDGALSVEGELSGVGTVICKGDLNMEASSQLSALDETGISLYSEGSIHINKISTMPKNIPGSTRMDQEDKQELDNLINFIDLQLNQSSQQSGVTSSQKPSLIIEAGSGGSNFNIELKSSQGVSQQIQASPPGNQVKQLELMEHLGLVRESDGGSKFSEIDEDTLMLLKSAKKIGLKYPEVEKNGRKVSPLDSVFRGLVFACKNFNVHSEDQAFRLEGGLVAFGGIPGQNVYEDSGMIKINASDVKFKYDTRYLSILKQLGENKIETLYWTTY